MTFIKLIIFNQLIIFDLDLYLMVKLRQKNPRNIAKVLKIFYSRTIKTGGEPKALLRFFLFFV
jgi:hypothetical protein